MWQNLFYRIGSKMAIMLIENVHVRQLLFRRQYEVKWIIILRISLCCCCCWCYVIRYLDVILNWVCHPEINKKAEFVFWSNSDIFKHFLSFLSLIANNTLCTDCRGSYFNLAHSDCCVVVFSLNVIVKEEDSLTKC